MRFFFFFNLLLVFLEVDSPTATNLVAVQVETTTEPITPKKEPEQEIREEVILPKSPENLPDDVSSSVEASPGKPAPPFETEETTTPVTETMIDEKNVDDDPEPMDTELKDEVTEEITTNDTEIKPNENDEVPAEEKSVEEEDFIKEEISSVSNAASTEEKTEDEEDDDEVILKNLDIPSGDDADAKKIRAAILRPSRNKKTSEVSEEEESVDESTKQRNRETRSKKISERSDDTEESPAPPRSTRRRGKLDDSSNERDDIAENKRLSRIKGIWYYSFKKHYIYFLKRYPTTTY